MINKFSKKVAGIAETIRIKDDELIALNMITNNALNEVDLVTTEELGGVLLEDARGNRIVVRPDADFGNLTEDDVLADITEGEVFRNRVAVKRFPE